MKGFQPGLISKERASQKWFIDPRRSFDIFIMFSIMAPTIVFLKIFEIQLFVPETVGVHNFSYRFLEKFGNRAQYNAFQSLPFGLWK